MNKHNDQPLGRSLRMIKATGSTIKRTLSDTTSLPWRNKVVVIIVRIALTTILMTGIPEVIGPHSLRSSGVSRRVTGIS